MKFIEEVKKLQEEFKGHVVLVKCGIFYTAMGKDAIILHELLGMHLICMKEKLCKSGVLDKNIDKFIKEMDERNLSFVICDYDKNNKKDIILFNLKQEEYIKWLYEQLSNMTYKHGGYRTFYIYEPKKRKIESSRYMDRIVHTWYVNHFMEEYFIKQFIATSYACIKKKGMHKAAQDVQKAMRRCKQKWQEYYILKMDVAKYFANIDKDKLYQILTRKIQDKILLSLYGRFGINGRNKEKSKRNTNTNSNIFKRRIGIRIK